MAPISLISQFSEKPRLIKRGKNAIRAGHVMKVLHHWKISSIKVVWETEAMMYWRVCPRKSNPTWYYGPLWDHSFSMTPSSSNQTNFRIHFIPFKMWLPTQSAIFSSLSDSSPSEKFTVFSQILVVTLSIKALYHLLHVIMNVSKIWIRFLNFLNYLFVCNQDDASPWQWAKNDTSRTDCMSRVHSSNAASRATQHALHLLHWNF